MERGWYLVELMGHRRIAGEVTEATVAGAAVIRVDIPAEPPLTQYYSGGAIYALTPITEALAREFAATHVERPIQEWDLPRRKALLPGETTDVDDAGWEP